MSTTKGRCAEALVAEYLKRHKHKILAMNWRTRWCEIDIVSRRKKVVYFTEVKYRSSLDWGGGLDYVTQKKLEQMRFAAEMWLAQNKWRGEAQLQAAAVDSAEDVEIIELF